MATKLVNEFPKCNFCGEAALYDAPTSQGSWAYMCSKCAARENANLNIGTTFKLRIKSTKPPASTVLQGIEDTDMDTLEDVTFGNTNREIECPNCGELKSVEPDASYTYVCEGCKSKVKVPESLIY